jgi:hypothetical protein
VGAKQKRKAKVSVDKLEGSISSDSKSKLPKDKYNLKSDNSKIKVGARDDSDFLERVGYESSSDKWACKNCIFQLVLDQLSYPKADY